MATTPGKIAVALMARHLHHGGTERQLAETALGLDPRRFETHVITLREGGFRWEQLRSQGIPVFSLNVHSFGSTQGFYGAKVLHRYIRQHNIGVVHAFDMPTVITAIPIVRLIGGVTAVASQRGHRSLYSSRHQALLRLADRFSHGIVVNCEFLHRHLVQDFGLPPSLIHIAYNGIDTTLFNRTTRPPLPAALAGAEGVIGTLSVLRAEKGIKTLLEAFSRIAPKHPGWKLAIVGSGPELERLRADALRLGLGENCWFEPSTDRVTEWLSAMDIFVLPTVNEALSNSLMEAMAVGCAPVATRVGGNPELVADGDNGMLFESGSASGLAECLESLIASPERRIQLGERSAEIIASRFSREAAARRMEAIYEGLVKG